MGHMPHQQPLALIALTNSAVVNANQDKAAQELRGLALIDSFWQTAELYSQGASAPYAQDHLYQGLVWLKARATREGVTISPPEISSELPPSIQHILRGYTKALENPKVKLLLARD